MKNRRTPRHGDARSAATRYPNMLLVVGVAAALAGGLLMLWNFGYLHGAGVLWPVPVIIMGLVFLYMAWPRRRSDRWIIPGMVLTLGGTAFLLINTVLQGPELARIWPVFMFVTGVSFVPYGYRKHGSARTVVVVPGLFLSLLALLFLPFSLHRTEGGFAAFVGQWWPLILVALGAALIVSFFSTRRPSKKV